MKTLKIIYLVLGIIALVDFLISFINPAETYSILFWETNVWVYRAYRLAMVLLFLKLYLDQRKAESLDSK